MGDLFLHVDTNEGMVEERSIKVTAQGEPVLNKQTCATQIFETNQSEDMSSLGTKPQNYQTTCYNGKTTLKGERVTIECESKAK